MAEKNPGTFYHLKDITEDVNVESKGCHFWLFGSEKRKIVGVAFNIHEISMWSTESVEEMIQKMTKEIEEGFPLHPKKAFFGYSIEKCQQHREFVYF